MFFWILIIVFGYLSAPIAFNEESSIHHYSPVLNYFFLPAFKIFSLFLAFSSLPIMHLVVGFFLYVFYLEVTDLGSLSWFFFFLTKHEKFSAILSPNIFLPLSLL